MRIVPALPDGNGDKACDIDVAAEGGKKSVALALPLSIYIYIYILLGAWLAASTRTAYTYLKMEMDVARKREGRVTQCRYHL